eukprot:CAMPEP_0185429970 /NCGR_PEP_ID=MMETSP1365-20130426/17115_1 /TAXON_ID=38817 /ORGANISM="Gephyrocapsa oceanica, Strain RCC1303" /LENGTH=63 /DNA_ID=CAMNT_0028034223 /DNA_START=1 /DNA_END=192 /DNA_ORIENTATION=+
MPLSEILDPEEVHSQKHTRRNFALNFGRSQIHHAHVGAGAAQAENVGKVEAFAPLAAQLALRP